MAKDNFIKVAGLPPEDVASLSRDLLCKQCPQDICDYNDDTGECTPLQNHICKQCTQDKCDCNNDTGECTT